MQWQYYKVFCDPRAWSHLLLNKTLELLLKNASIACAGVYTAADDGVINPSNIRITPGSIIPVARNGGPQGASLAPLPRSGDFNVSQIVINDLINYLRIKSSYIKNLKLI